MKTLIILTLPLLLVSCNQMKKLYKQINDYGYIEYKTPLADAGPGALVGGSPKSLSLVSASETCFPSEIDGVSTGLYYEDTTVIPKKNHRVTVSNSTTVSLANFMSSGTPTLGAGVNFDIVKTMSVDMEGATVVYLDSVRLTDFYNNHMSETCKEYLDHVGFIVQALKVEKMEVRFYDKHGVAINVGLQNIESIVDINEEVSWEVEDETVLVIDSPKFIGYQLGQLKREDNGYALYRATRVKNGKFYFESLDVFDNDKKTKSRYVVEEPSLDEFADLKKSMLLKRNSRYR